MPKVTKENSRWHIYLPLGKKYLSVEKPSVAYRCKGGFFVYHPYYLSSSNLVISINTKIDFFMNIILNAKKIPLLNKRNNCELILRSSEVVNVFYCLCFSA